MTAEDVTHVDPPCVPADGAVGTDQPYLEVIGVFERRQACGERLRRGMVAGGGRVITQGLGFEDGLYLLDEPEAAVSPQRQLAFLRILHELTSRRVAQFIIATHSPIILAFPGATVWSLDGGRIDEIDYRDTEHFRVTRDFLESPERFFRHLFSEPEGEESELDEP